MRGAFGRLELFAVYWGAEERARATAEDPRNHPITDALNTKPKYLASTTLTEPRRANTTVLSDDITAAIGELKRSRAGELQVHGSGTLIRSLLDNDLVDAITLLIVPVVVGQGTPRPRSSRTEAPPRGLLPCRAVAAAGRDVERTWGCSR